MAINYKKIATIVIFILNIVSLIPLIINAKKLYDNKFNIKTNWGKDVINEIQIIPSDKMCPPPYETLIETQIIGNKNGCFSFEGNKFYEDKNCFDLNITNGVDIIESKTKSIDNFAFYENDQRKTLISWKLCGKKLDRINYSNPDALLSICDENNETTCQLESGKFFCVERGQECIEDQVKECGNDQIRCEDSIKLGCYSDITSCSEVKLQCQINQKPCVTQNSVICISSLEKCPITNIKIQLKSEKQIEGYSQEQITFESDYALYAKREDHFGYPVVDFVLSMDEGVYLTDKFSKVSDIFDVLQEQESTQNKDNFDSRYTPVSSVSLNYLDLLKSNQIEQNPKIVQFMHNKGNYQLFQRHYFSYNHECNYNYSILKDFKDFDNKIRTFSISITVLGFFASISFLIVILRGKQDIQVSSSFYAIFQIITVVSIILQIISLVVISKKIKTFQGFIDKNCFDHQTQNQLDSYKKNIWDVLNMISSVLLYGINLILNIVFINTRIINERIGVIMTDISTSFDWVDCILCCKDCCDYKREKSSGKSTSNSGSDGGCDCDCDCNCSCGSCGSCGSV